jgi:hypothetical protein
MCRGLHVVRIAAASCLLAVAACGKNAVPVVYRPGHSFSAAERRAIESVTDRAVRDVRVLLPTLPTTFGLIVSAGEGVIPETGETGSVSMPSGVYWTVDPEHEGGVIAVVKAQLRATLFHELYHMVRDAVGPPRSLVDLAIDEGLATVFERDFGTGTVPWGEYPPNAAEWTTEFLVLPPEAPRQQWMVRHFDGRRWIGYKVGTYLVDRAIQASGRSVTDLVTVTTEEIIRWAGQA